LTTTDKTVKSSIPNSFELEPVCFDFRQFLRELVKPNRSQFESGVRHDSGVMIFDNLVVDNLKDGI